jgi:hypothetical protein
MRAERSSDGETSKAHDTELRFRLLRARGVEKRANQSAPSRRFARFRRIKEFFCQKIFLANGAPGLNRRAFFETAGVARQ